MCCLFDSPCTFQVLTTCWRSTLHISSSEIQSLSSAKKSTRMTSVKSIILKYVSRARSRVPGCIQLCAGKFESRSNRVHSCPRSIAEHSVHELADDALQAAAPDVAYWLASGIQANWGKTSNLNPNWSMDNGASSTLKGALIQTHKVWDFPKLRECQKYFVPQVQLTDFENAAYAVFIVLITRVILSFKLNMLIPISKVSSCDFLQNACSILLLFSHWWMCFDAPHFLCETLPLKENGLTKFYPS